MSPAPAGLNLAVDGSSLARPLAGVGTYTREIVAAMRTLRPGSRLTLWGPPGAASRTIPTARLIGRHLLWAGALNREGYDAYFGAAGLLPLRRPSIPAVVTAHDMAIYRHPEWFPGGQQFSVRVVVPLSMRRANAVIAVSSQTARDIADLFGVEAMVIPEGVAGIFQPLPERNTIEVRRQLQLPERYVLFVGTVEPRKNLPTLLDAWARMRRRPSLVVAGTWGWRYETIQAKLERLGGGVKLLGAVHPSRLPALYNLATCLAHPAWYEGFGLTPLEAMACGTPVVASSAASVPEVVGDAGLLVEPGDVEAWTRALQRVCEEPELQSTLRRRGLLRAAEFSWERAAERTWRVVESCVRAARE